MPFDLGAAEVYRNARDVTSWGNAWPVSAVSIRVQASGQRRGVGRLLIVALHGLNRHAYKTWTDENNHLWLCDSLPQHVPDARIMTFGYDSAVRHSDSRMQLSDFAEDLLVRLLKSRQDPLERERPLIFLCHSLGGLVVKHALVLASLRKEDYGDIVASTTSIAFFGTPHRGSRMASLGRTLSQIINTATLARNLRTDLLSDIRIQSRHLDYLSRLSTGILSEITIVSFYEQEPDSSIGSLIRLPLLRAFHHHLVSAE